MNRTLKATIAAVLLGTAALAVAQSPAESFADRIKQFQALSGAGPAFKPQPTFSSEPRAAAPLSIREFQAMSSDSLAWHLDRGEPVARNWAAPADRPANVRHASGALSSPSN